jgi:hypothetical protein
MSNKFKHNGNELTAEFQSAPDYLKSGYKINFTESGFYEQADDVMLVKSGVTALGGAWFTAAHPNVRYKKNSSPRPFVRAYGACIPDTNNPSAIITKGYNSNSNARTYWRWDSTTNYIQNSSYGLYPRFENVQQSYSGLMFIEMQGPGGGGGGSYYYSYVVTSTTRGGSGGGGGAYISMCCRQLGGDVNFAWPSAEIAVMGAESAAEVIKPTQPDFVEDYKARISNPQNALDNGSLDEIIEPSTTRQRVITALERIDASKPAGPWKKHDNMPL